MRRTCAAGGVRSARPSKHGAEPDGLVPVPVDDGDPDGPVLGAGGRDVDDGTDMVAVSSPPRPQTGCRPAGPTRCGPARPPPRAAPCVQVPAVQVPHGIQGRPERPTGRATTMPFALTRFTGFAMVTAVSCPTVRWIAWRTPALNSASPTVRGAYRFTRTPSGHPSTGASRAGRPRRVSPRAARPTTSARGDASSTRRGRLRGLGRPSWSASPVRGGSRCSCPARSTATAPQCSQSSTGPQLRRRAVQVQTRGSRRYSPGMLERRRVSSAPRFQGCRRRRVQVRVENQAA